MKRIVFVDSRQALDWAYGLGLHRDCEIRTTAPALTIGDDVVAEVPNNLATPARNFELARRTFGFCADVHDRLLAEPRFRDLAMVGAQLGMYFPNVVQKGMALCDSDFKRPVTIVRVKMNSEVDDRLCNMPWPELLARHQDLHVIDVPSDSLPDINRRPAEATHFMDRQHLGGWEKLGFQFVDAIWRHLPIRSPRGTFLILRENILLRETALSLALGGWGLSYLQLPSAKLEVTERAQSRDLAEAVLPAVRDFVKDFVPTGAVEALQIMFAAQLAERVLAFDGSLEYWRQCLCTAGALKPKAVLTNMLPRPEVVALHRVCKEHNLPVAAFQHGVAREIGSNNSNIQAYFEGNTSDVFYTFNEEAAKVSDTCYFNQASSVPVGLPAGFWRGGTYRHPRPDHPPLIYASTSLYYGNLNLIAGAGVSDYIMARTEMRLVLEVFARLPHALLYKPYPNDRYLDDDPVIECANRVQNIKVFQYRDDLSYLLPDCRVIISSRATSTVSWCATSGKPFVYIHYPHDKPLRSDAREEFEQAFFMFDGAADDFHERLQKFLSQPIEAIERAWAEREKVRKRVIRRFFGNPEHHAGGRAARHLLDEVVSST